MLYGNRKSIVGVHLNMCLYPSGVFASLYIPGIIIVRLDRFWDLGTFPIGSRSYPRIRPHDLAIQIDIIGAFLFRQGALGRWYHERAKN